MGTTQYATPIVMIALLIISVIFHEIAHGLVALWFGDRTAKDAGRLTLNPIPHIDPIGSIILPLFFALTGSHFMIAWARPVPINDVNLKPYKLGLVCVSLAGIVTNFLLAFIVGILLQIGIFDPQGIVTGILLFFVYINILLGVFNLLPIPPLDGSHFWTMFLPMETQMAIQRNFFMTFAIIILFWLYFSKYVLIVAIWLFKIFIGS